jgi:hypothetical protein
MLAQRPTISAAVTECLTSCRSSSNPWAIAKLFIDRLRGLPEWTPDEIEEVWGHLKARIQATEDKAAAFPQTLF